MADGQMLSQSEIDALLRAAVGEEAEKASGGRDEALQNGQVTGPTPQKEYLNAEEKDALGEIGNITMGSASTTLSELLQQKVVITSPRVNCISQSELFDSFGVPHIVIQVEFTSGLQGYNVLVIRLRDAMVMASLMMGGDGTALPEAISELEISAASEAMNQMIGTASTSLANMFGRSINISPPVTTVLEERLENFRLPTSDTLVVVSFDMQIGNLLNTQIMQILSIETAKEEASLLWDYLMGMSSPAGDKTPEASSHETGDFKEDYRRGLDIPGSLEELTAFPEITGTSRQEGQMQGFNAGQGFPGDPTPPERGWPEADQLAGAGYYGRQGFPSQPSGTYTGMPGQGSPAFPALSQAEQRKLDLLLDVPLKVSVILGRTKRPIKEVLNFTPGAIVELTSLIDEPLEILVNGTLVARGEVVVVNENFGVRITNIISPEERLKQLKG